MSTFSIYRLDTGLFTGARYDGDEDFAALNTPEGCDRIEGAFDPLCQRVDLSTGEVAPYQPTMPDPAPLRDWVWDTSTMRWTSVPTFEARKLERIAAVQQALADAEQGQDRAQREVLLAMLAGTTPPADASARLQQIEAAAAPLRATLQALQAAATQDELDAVPVV